MSDWKKRLADKRAASKTEVTLSPRRDFVVGWRIDEIFSDQNVLGRETGKFFKREGLVFYGVAGCWGRLFIGGQDVDIYVIVLDIWDNFLVTMRQELGNPAAKQHVLLGPPLQASFANMQQAHGGKRPPRAEFYDDPRVVWADAPKDGGRFIESVNRIGILRLPSLASLKLLPDEIILSRNELKEAFFAGELNPYLREAGMALL
jgi:hypothetical protein